MKKLIAFFLIATMSLCFTACGGSDSEEDSYVDKSKEPVYIMIQNAGYGYKWLEEVGKNYTRKTKH